MRGLLRSWHGFGLVVLGRPSSKLICLSSYQVDPSRDENGGEGGSRSSGGKASGGSSVIPNAGEAAGGDQTTTTGGSAAGGKSSTTGGEPELGGTPGAAGEMQGDAGMPGTPSKCSSVRDCDDTIHCTVDACGGDGKCTHTPKDSVCDAAQCEVCTIGIGCVAGPKQTTQI